MKVICSSVLPVTFGSFLERIQRSLCLSSLKNFFAFNRPPDGPQSTIAKKEKKSDLWLFSRFLSLFVDTKFRFDEFSAVHIKTAKNTNCRMLMGGRRQKSLLQRNRVKECTKNKKRKKLGKTFNLLESAHKRRVDFVSDKSNGNCLVNDDLRHCG